MDFAEQLESVAYVLCREEQITLEKFEQIWHAKGVSDIGDDHNSDQYKES